MHYFINPNLVVQKDDFLGSGIPYLPHILAYTLGLLRQHKQKFKLIDSFGQNPGKLTLVGEFYWQGITINEILSQIITPQAVFIYASSVTNIDFNIKLSSEIRKKFPDTKIIFLANTQAVTSFDIRYVANDLLHSGANLIIYNNIENSTFQLIKSNFKYQKFNIISLSLNKVIVAPMSQQIGETSSTLLPAWDLFPLKNYWQLGYSHGPVEKKFLPILTSYGCPFQCEFCVNPSINSSRWQSKSAGIVFKEIKYLVNKFNVREFHIEDLDPTVDKNRIQELCRKIINAKLKIYWKIVSGTKVETLDEPTLILMKQAGCNYISISPESGSTRVLKLMNKPFNFDFANKIISVCHQIGIKTQACFVLGFPEENNNDLKLTNNYIRHITELGIDEIALFIATPLPGSKLFKRFSGFNNYSSLTFSPKWRENYKYYEHIRFLLYRNFIFWKFRFYPFSIFRQLINLLIGRFETKMEMIPYRILKFNWLLFKNRVKI